MRSSLRANIELVTQVVVAIAILIATGVLVKRTPYSNCRLGTKPEESRVFSKEGLPLLHLERKPVSAVDG